MTEYDEEGYEIEYDHEGERADREYDEMRDDFMMIENEAGAIRCMIQYPSVAEHYMPKQYRYLLTGEKKDDTTNKRNKNS